MSNNLPSHILVRPSRHADLIIAFDASSDVQPGLLFNGYGILPRIVFLSYLM